MRRLIFTGCLLCVFLLTGCTFIKFKPETDMEKVNETAISYLNERYHESFEVVDSSKLTNSILGGDHWICCKVVKQSEQENENSIIYEVNIEFDGETYQVVGESYLYSFIRNIAEKHLDSVFDQYLHGFCYEYFLSYTNTAGDSRIGGYEPYHEIPKTMDDVTEINPTQVIFIDIIIPDNGDTVLDSAVDRIKIELEKEDVHYMIKFFVIKTADYQKIISSDNPQQEWEKQDYDRNRGYQYLIYT